MMSSYSCWSYQCRRKGTTQKVIVYLVTYSFDGDRYYWESEDGIRGISNLGHISDDWNDVGFVETLLVGTKEAKWMEVVFSDEAVS